MNRIFMPITTVLIGSESPYATVCISVILAEKVTIFVFFLIVSA